MGSSSVDVRFLFTFFVETDELTSSFVRAWTPPDSLKI